MTVSEAHVVLFVGEALAEVSKSLRAEQIAALNDALDTPQKILLLEILTAVVPPQDDQAIRPANQAAWLSLVESAKARLAASADSPVEADR